MKGEKQNMNKLFTKIAKAFLGLSMAIGVGVAIGTGRKDASPAHATTGAISSFSALSGNIVANKVTYSSGKGNGTNAPIISSNTLRLYKPASGKSDGGFITVTAASGVTLTSVTFTNSADKAGSIKTKVDSGSLSSSESLAKSAEKTLTGLSASSVSIYNAGSDRLSFAGISVEYSEGSTPSTYTVTYNPVSSSGTGTGTITDSNSPYNSGVQVTVLGSTGFTAPSGKEFSHWYTTSTGTGGTSYNPGDKFTINANTTLYAQWVEKSGDYTKVSTTIQAYATAHSWSNAIQYSSVSLDSNITVTCSGGGNTGKYYTSGNEWRTYQGESATITVSATSGNLIHSIKITYNISNTGVLKDKDNNSVSSGSSVSAGDVSSYTFSVGNSGSATNGQVKITAIEVEYSSEGSSLEDLQITYTSASLVELTIGGTTTSQISGVNVNGCTYATGDASVATVSSTGLITAVGTGSTTITISHEDDATYHYLNATVNVSVTKTYDYSTTLSVVTFDQAYAATPNSGDSDSMMVVGHISSMDTSNTQHGNGYLAHTSSDKTLRIYGMYDVDGNKGTSMTNPTVPVADDVVVLEGVFCFYNSTWEIKNAVVRQKNGTVYNYPATITGISVKTAPTKVTYNSGEYFNPSGLIITVSYSDSTSTEVTYSGNESDFTFTPSTTTALTTSNTSITISYGGQDTTQAITVNAVPAVLSVTVSPSSGLVNIGSSTTLTANVSVEGGAAQTVSWGSSDDSIATVANGVVTGVAAGTATITATSTVDNSKSGSATIEVVDPTDTKMGTYTLIKDVSLLGAGDWIVITNIDGTYGMGEQGSNSYRSQVAVTLTGSDIVISNTSNTSLKAAKLSVKNSHFEIKTDEGYLYANTSSNNYVGSRATNSDANGEWVFTINSSSGDATCIAQGSNSRKSLRYNSGNTRFSCYAETNTMADIHIYKKLPGTAAVSLTSNKEVLTSIGDTATLTAKAYSDSGKTKEIAGLTNTDFAFTSGNTNILTVSESGVVTAVASGETTITVSRDEYEDSVTIKVVYVTIDLINNGTSVEAGDEGTFTFTWSNNSLKPDTYDVEWSSNNNDAFVVSNDGSYLAGDAGETATITVTVIDEDLNEYVATKAFSTVSTVVAATHISVIESSGVTAYIGTNVNLSISVLGENDALATNQNVVCTSSDNNILTVTNAGVITPQSRGIATVTIIDEGELCTPVVINVRVRNAVLGEATVMGVLNGPDTTDTATDISGHFVTENSFAAPSAVTQTSGYNDRSGYYRIAAGSSSGSISISYDDLYISKIVVVGKRYSANKADPTVEGAAASSAFTADDTTVTFTFAEAVKEFTLLAASGQQFCCKSITVYGVKANVSLDTDAQALYGFEESKMHLDDYSSNLGYCKDTEHHYYSTAKAAFNALTKDQRDMYVSNEAFTDGWARLSAWATANGESLNSSNQLAARPGISPLVNIIGENTNTVTIIVIISMVSVTAIGGYFFLKKRKEN